MKSRDVLSENDVRKLSTTYGVCMVISLGILGVYLALAFSKVCDLQSTKVLMLIVVFIIITTRRDSLLENHKIYNAITGQGKEEK